MDTHIVKVLKTSFITHNVKSFILERPQGYHFIPGQATDVAINTATLINELRPFTIVSGVEDNFLEFVIKIYKGHNGITEKMLETKPGDEWVVHEVFGTLPFRGPGIFLSGGAAVTPFISALRELSKLNRLKGNTLLLANRTKDDIICEDELAALLGNKFINVLESTPEKNGGEKYISLSQIQTHIDADTQFYYLCGPTPFMAHCNKLLQQLNVPAEKIITES